MRRLAPVPLVSLLAVLAALAAPGASKAVGPSLPALEGAVLTAPQGNVAFVTALMSKGAATRLEERHAGSVTRSVTLRGSWGIQLATLGGALAGISRNGRVLVLSDNVRAGVALRAHSHFAVVDTGSLRLAHTVTLAGDYSVDALSPDGSILYLIHHIAKDNATKYQVQAYDLRARQLLPGVIADKSQAGWTMAGYPVSRAATADGSWVYTFYRQDGNYPFVHALDTATRTAVCIGIPADSANDSGWLSTATLKLVGGTLQIRTAKGEVRYLLDTTTFRVSTP